MAITTDDVKILKSENMSNTEQGGGRMTVIELIDGQVNDVFPSISTIDTVYGSSEHYKMFLAVTSENTDIFQEAFIALVKKPTNPKVEFILFSTGSHIDHNDESKNYIENYVTAGIKMPMELLGNQVKGQRVLLAYQFLTDPLPDVGQIITLVEDEEGDNIQEYVRITNITSEERTFNLESCGEFKSRVLTLDISAPLQNTFHGDGISCNTVSANAFIRSTNTVASAKYYGISQLIEPVNAGYSILKIDSIFASIVPATQKEVALTDQSASLGKKNNILLGYAKMVFGYISHTVNADLISSAITVKKDIIEGTRTYSHVITLNPLPMPTSVSINFMSGGKWYSITEDVSGTLAGNGDGSINHETGTISFTLAVLPDLNTKLIITYQNVNEFFQVVDTQIDHSHTLISDWGGTNYKGFSGLTWYGDLIEEKAYISHSVPDSIVPSSLQITYLKEGNPVILSSNNLGEIIENGNVIGKYRSTGEIYFAPNFLPDAESNINYLYDTPDENGTQNVIEETITPTTVAGTSSFTLSELPEEGSVVVTWIVSIININTSEIHVFDAFNGISVEEYDNLTDTVKLSVSIPSSSSTINYLTGEITLDVLPKLYYYPSNYFHRHIKSSLFPIALLGDINVVYTKAGTPTLPKVSTSNSVATLRLLSEQNDKIIPNTLFFWVSTITSNFYHSASDKTDLVTEVDGKLLSLKNVNPAEYFERNAGSVDFNNSTIEYIPKNNATHNRFYFMSCMAQRGKWTTPEFIFKVNIAPIAPLSFQLRFEDIKGNTQIITSELNGDFSNSGVSGHIDNTTAIVDLTFNSPVEPDKIFYNAVGLSYLPLDAKMLGLNTVRLPGNGKIPIIKQSDIVLIREEKSEVMPNPLSANDVFVGSVAPAASGQLIDNNDLIVDTALYTLDKSTNTVTMSNPLDLSTYSQPLHYEYAFEDLQLVTDVNIDGTIQIAAGVNHNYSTAAAVSSILRFGDLQARMTVSFSQQTWTGVWSDDRIGSNTTSQYDFVNYPLQLQNKNSIKERWLIKFTSSTAFELIGESLGLIATGDISTDLAPLNPNTGEPYFIMLAAGWGGGWSTGYVERHNTEVCAAPFRLARTILPGGQALNEDNVVLYRRGDSQ